MTQILLYDLRSSDAQNGFIQACNRSLAADPEKQYLNRYGAIGSEKWWGHFDAGEIELKTRSGAVTHIGPMNDHLSDEVEDIVCFDANGRSHCYDRDGVWADERIQIGDIISVLRTTATIPSKNGDETWLIDVRITLEKAANNRVNRSGESGRH